MICVVCPLGCRLSVTVKDGVVEKVKGNICKRGAAYAVSEHVNPVRMLTTTAAVKGGGLIAVKTAVPIPKGRLFDCLEIIKKITAVPPIKVGDVLVENIGGTGVSVIATMNFGEMRGADAIIFG
jgi:CxxC motif-containing protein